MGAKDALPPDPGTFEGRVEISKRHGKFRSDQHCADAVTAYLRKLGVQVPPGGVPYQTIQSARSKGNDGSKYTLAIAAVCGVNPYWLAFGDAAEKMLAAPGAGKPSWPFHIDFELWERLGNKARTRAEAGILEVLLEVAEMQDASAAESKSQRTARR